MLGVHFHLPYLGRVSLKPLIYSLPHPLSSKGDYHYTKGEIQLALLAYHKSLLTEKDSPQVRNNISSCFFLLGKLKKSYKIFKSLKSNTQISIFNLSLSCASMNLPAEGLEVLTLSFNDPALSLLKAILYHLNNDSITAFKYISELNSESNSEPAAIYYNITHNLNRHDKELLFARGKEKLHKTVQNYLEGFFNKVNNKATASLSLPVLAVEEPQKPEIEYQTKNKRGTRLSASVVLKNNKNILKRIIDPPEKRVKNLSPISHSPGFKIKEASSNNKLLAISEFKPPAIGEYAPDTDIDVDVDLDAYNHLSLQSLMYIASEYNKPDKNIEILYEVLKNLKFFSKHKPKIVKELIKISKYEKKRANTTILREGEEGLYVYIIISGSVAVIKNRADCKPLVINSAYDGDIIGEYSFIRKIVDHKPGIRSATCITTEECHLIKIANKDLSHTIETYIDMKNEYLYFIKQMPLFQNITEVDLALLANTITAKQYEMDSCILSAGDYPENMFIVYKGRVKIKYPARKTKYSNSLKAVKYSNITKELFISSGSFFGQRALIDRKLPANYAVYSDSISYTTLIIIHKSDFEQLFYPIQQQLLLLITKAPEFDLKIPDEYSYL